MDNVMEFWRFIRAQTTNQSPVMLLYVVESLGSSPGRQGFCLAVNAAGEMIGSVGGGIMEYKFVEMAKELLAGSPSYNALHKQVHNKEAVKNQSGMICSGEQTILLYLLQPHDHLSVNAVIDCLQRHAAGCLSFSEKGMSFSDRSPANRYTFVPGTGNAWLYEEQIGYHDHLYIIGAGHCGLALSKQMRALDFYIHLLDERNDLNTIHENDFVHEIIMLDSYHAIAPFIKEGANSYVVVMTPGYRTDDMVIRALLYKQFRYLGVLGSASKIKTMFTGYTEEGIDPGFLKNIHAPVGLPIKSHTPEEIAISIAAQVIAVKNG